VRQLLLIRHGQSTWNADGRWQGHFDAPLSELGERQAAAAVDAVAALGIAGLVTSDLQRAHRTAELVQPPEVSIVVDAALRERDAGAWTGLTRDEIEERYPGDLAAYRSGPGFEGDDALLARVVPGLTALVPGPDDEVVLVVTHGGVIRVLERLLGAPSVPVPNLGGRWLHDDGAGGLALGERELLIDPDAVALTVPDQL
jgi:broad specificity phosphatase PhoE